MVDQPNARYPHAFVVLRIDDNPGSAVENQISPVATYLDRILADAEMGRLNDLNVAKGSRYLVLVSRLKG
jgi:hypothetical protein